MNDKVSIIMGLYNCGKTLSTAIDSILTQTYENWELIMCDDGSTDNTYSVALKYVENYPDKIKLIKHDKNQSLSASLNDCLKFATGYFVARMDADDKCLSNRIELQVNYLKSHPDIQLVATAMQRFHDDCFDDIVSLKEFPSKYDLRYGTVFCHATIMTYKYVYDELGGYKVSDMTVRSQDYDLWFRFFYKGFKGINLNEPLYLVREDINAIKRRTFSNRYNIFRIQVNGFKLLGFPKTWLIKPFFDFIFKGIIPARLIFLFRKNQRSHKNNDKY